MRKEVTIYSSDVMIGGSLGQHNKVLTGFILLCFGSLILHILQNLAKTTKTKSQSLSWIFHADIICWNRYQKQGTYCNPLCFAATVTK